MKSFIGLALAASALAIPAPQASTPEGCSDSRAGSFGISVLNVTSSASKLRRRQVDGGLKITLAGGQLKDQNGRTGSIVANHQFQFDEPVQTDAISTSGFSVCGNNSLAHDGSAIWYQCLSGDFYNLYDQSLGEHCNAIYIIATGDSGVSQAPDGQPAASTQLATVSQLPDGQPQATTAPAPVSQIGDGQIQAPTGAPVSQIGDGQIQAPAGAPVSQIGDGQIQAPTGAPVSQIGDGQIQAPTGAPVSQIGDGQIQAPTAAPTPVTPTTVAPGPVISQIADGQPQAPVASGNFTAPNASASAPAAFTGSASTPMVGAGAFAAALAALVTLL